MQLMTVSGRLSGDPSFLGLPTTREIRSTQTIKELTKQCLRLQVQRTQGVPIPSAKAWRTIRCVAIDVTRFPNPETFQRESHRHRPTQEEGLQQRREQDTEQDSQSEKTHQTFGTIAHQADPKWVARGTSGTEARHCSK